MRINSFLAHVSFVTADKRSQLDGCMALMFTLIRSYIVENCNGHEKTTLNDIQLHSTGRELY